MVYQCYKTYIYQSYTNEIEDVTKSGFYQTSSFLSLLSKMPCSVIDFSMCTGSTKHDQRALTHKKKKRQWACHRPCI